MERGDSRGRPGDVERRPGLHDPRRNRAACMALYRAVRNLLEMGATAGQARRAFELAVTSRRPWDLAVFDDNIAKLKRGSISETGSVKPVQSAP